MLLGKQRGEFLEKDYEVRRLSPDRTAKVSSDEQYEYLFELSHWHSGVDCWSCGASEARLGILIAVA